MQTEVTLQVVITVNAQDPDDHEDQVSTIVMDLEARGYDVMIEDEERLDDVYDLLDDEDSHE